jgi:DNA-binding Lrp family transcriptional regulator
VWGGRPPHGRASTAELARLVGRSRTTVQARIERLERDGVIIGYTARLAPEREQGAVRAHVMIKVEPKKEAAVGAALRTIDEVRVLHTVAGVFDMIVVAAADTVAQIETVIDRIGNLEGVERTTSSIILSTKLER